MEGELKVTAANPFTTRLRNETAKAHELLEELPLSQALISEELTTEQYLHYLSIMHSIVLATERDLYPRVEKFFPDIQKRVKIHLINADLETLNNKFTLPEFNFEPVSDEEAVGMLYVMEGSVLGGRYILTNVQQNLNLSAD